MNIFYEKFDLSENGFLPSTPIICLDSNLEWEELTCLLPVLNKTKSLCEYIDKLPEFDIKQINTQNKIKRAYVIFCLISNSYINNITLSDPFNIILPKKISIPFFEISKMLGINPVITHAAVDLYNWQQKNIATQLDLDNMKIVSSFTGTIDEEWFYLIMTAIENIGGKIINDFLNDFLISDKDNIFTKEIISKSSIHTILCFLEKIACHLKTITGILKRIYEKCDPNIFYNTIRPFLTGSKNNILMPKGLIFENVNNDKPFMLYGGSAAESSLIQFIDIILGVIHADDYFTEIRSYMPAKHKYFLEYVEKLNFKKFLLCDEQIINAHKKCLNCLSIFRKNHFSLVRDYILIPCGLDIKNKNIREDTSQNDSYCNPKGTSLESDNSDSKSTYFEDTFPNSPKGTGGTDLSNFLITSIRETMFLNK